MKINILEKDRQFVWHPYTQAKTALDPINIVKGEGVYLYDEQGNAYLDGISSWWVSIHGHANKYIAKKVYEQMLQLEHVIFAGYTHPSAVILAERLIRILPDNQQRVFYSDNGSTAVEVALKMAFQYYYNLGVKRDKIIAFKDAYHGDTFGAMSVSGRSVFTNPFTPLLFDVEFIDLPVPGKEDESYKQFRKAIDNDNVAAFIFEPLIQGAGGMNMYEPEILEKMVLYAKASQVLTIADEVMTGFGRTGRMFACDLMNVEPDIFCLSKGLSGGTMPLGVTTCSERIYKAFLSDDKIHTLFHGHSFTANPVACAAALASLDLVEKVDFYDNIKRIEAHNNDFKTRIQIHPACKNVRTKGVILAIEMKTKGKSGYTNKIADKAMSFFRERKIIMRPLGTVIYIMPPYIMTNEQLDEIYSSIGDFLDTL